MPDIDTEPTIDSVSEPATDSGPRGPVTGASERLVATVAGLDADAYRGPSPLPGWTRAHVVVHLARNADSLTNLLTWARTGEPTYQYDSATAREAQITAGVARPPEEAVDDLRDAIARFAQAVVDLPDDAWSTEVRRGPGGTGEAIPARRVMWSRLLEVEVHHVDLDAGYTPDDWPAAFVTRALTETAGGFRRHEGFPPLTLDVGGRTEVVRPGGPTVGGSASALLAWLIGRSSGADLTADGPLPALPAWK